MNKHIKKKQIRVPVMDIETLVLMNEPSKKNKRKVRKKISQHRSKIESDPILSEGIKIKDVVKKSIEE